MRLAIALLKNFYQIHRRLKNDDHWGVDEPLKEDEYGKGVTARGQHYLTFGPRQPSKDTHSSIAIQRDIMQRKHLAPWIFIGKVDDETNLKDLQKLLNFEVSILKKKVM